MHRAIMGLFVALALAAPLRAEEAPTDGQITALIKQLSDDSFDTRDQAFKRLLALGPAALPALQKAASEPQDPETRLRATALVKALTRDPKIGQACEDLDAAELQTFKAAAKRIWDECANERQLLDVLRDCQPKTERGQWMQAQILKTMKVDDKAEIVALKFDLILLRLEMEKK